MCLVRYCHSLSSCGCMCVMLSMSSARSSAYATEVIVFGDVLKW